MMIAIEIKVDRLGLKSMTFNVPALLNAKGRCQLWDKIGEGTDDTNTPQMYVQLCLFVINNMQSLFEARAEELCLRFIALDDLNAMVLKLLSQLYIIGTVWWSQGFVGSRGLLWGSRFELLLAGYYASLSDYPQAEHFANLAFKLSKWSAYREAAVLSFYLCSSWGHRQKGFWSLWSAIELNPSNKQLKWNSS